MNKLFRAYLLSMGVLLGLFSPAPAAAKSSTKCLLKNLSCQVSQLPATIKGMLGCTSTAITGPGEIGVPGNYSLANDIYGSIIFTVPNITLDLCGHTIYPIVPSDTVRSVTRASSEVHGIHVMLGADHATILNSSLAGGISGFSNGSAIFNDGASLLQVGEVKSFSNKRGFSSANAVNAYFRNCWSVNDFEIGFFLDTCSGHILFGCKVVGANAICKSDCGVGDSETDVRGIYAINGSDNIIEECAVEGVIAGGAGHASAITLLNESGSKVVGCTADGVSSQLGAARGVSLQSACDLVKADCTNYGAAIHALSFFPALEAGLTPRYFVLSGDSFSGSIARLYAYNPLQGSISQQQVLLTAVTGSVSYTNAWDAAGKFFAVGGPAKAVIYSFDKSAGSATQVASITLSPGTTVYSLAWRPVASGTTEYLAITFLTSTHDTIVRIYSFDTVSHVVSAVGGDQTPYVSPTVYVSSLSWSPDGIYLAAGVVGVLATACLVYSFDTVTPLTVFDTISVTGGIDVHSVSWRPLVSKSPDFTSKIYYLSLSGLTGTIKPNFFIKALSFIGPVHFFSTFFSSSIFLNAQSTVWSPDGAYAGIGASDGSGNGSISVYSYDGIIKGDSPCVVQTSVGDSPALDWSRGDVQLIITGGGIGNACIYANEGCMNCIVQNNTLNNVSSFASDSVGVHADSTLNYVANNTVLNTPNSYIAVAPDLVTDQVNAITAGNVFSGQSSSFKGTIILTLKNEWDQAIQVNGSSLGVEQTARNVHIPWQDPSNLDFNKCLHIVVPTSEGDNKRDLFDYNWALWRYPGPAIFTNIELCKCLSLKSNPLRNVYLTIKKTASDTPKYNWVLAE